MHTDKLFPGHYTQQEFSDNQFVGRVVSDVIPKKNTHRAEVELLLGLGQTKNKLLDGRIIVYFEKDSATLSLGHGDTLMLSGWLNEVKGPQNPSEFNYQRYLGFHQVSHQMYVKSGSWKLISQGTGVVRAIIDWQKKVLKILTDKGFEDRELAIVSALLVGYKHFLSNDQKISFASAGAMHVLAVSGLHVGIVFLIVTRLLKPIERMRYGNYLAGSMAIMALWLYAAITGFSPSVSRAATMFTFIVVAQHFKRNTDIFNTLASSAFLLLVIDPYLIVEVGFQLSYLAVLGIVILQPRLYALWKPTNWLLDKAWAISTVSIAAQAATFPLGLLYFHQFPTYFLVSNLAVIPAATVILPLGIALISFHWVPLLSDALGTLLYWIVHFLDRFVERIQELPGALISGIDISIFETYFIYMIVATATAFLISRRYAWLIYFLVAVISIEGSNIYEMIQQKKQEAIYVYRVLGHNSIDFVSGNQHFFMSDDSLLQDFDKLRFHIHHHWWNLDLKKPEKVDIQSGLFTFGDYKVVVLGKERIALPKSVDCNLLYIKERTAFRPQRIIDSISSDLVVLSANLDRQSSNYWQDILQTNAIKYHDLRNDGSLTYSKLH
ncbi:MAG: ComEC/Rec2 family competence protein [Salibacteraceae bacterium]